MNAKRTCKLHGYMVQIQRVPNLNTMKIWTAKGPLSLSDSDNPQYSQIALQILQHAKHVTISRKAATLIKNR